MLGKSQVGHRDPRVRNDFGNMSSCSSCCCCCWCLVAIGSLSLAILVGGVIYWLFAMGLYSNLVNISFTAGAAIIIGGIIIGGITIGGILSLLFL